MGVECYVTWSPRPPLTHGRPCGHFEHDGKAHQTDEWLERVFRTRASVGHKRDLWQVLGELLTTAKFLQTHRLKQTLKTRAKPWLPRWSRVLTLQGNNQQNEGRGNRKTVRPVCHHVHSALRDGKCHRAGRGWKLVLKQCCPPNSLSLSNMGAGKDEAGFKPSSFLNDNLNSVSFSLPLLLPVLFHKLVGNFTFYTISLACALDLSAREGSVSQIPICSVH